MYDLTEVAEYWAADRPAMSHHKRAHSAWSEHGRKHAAWAERTCPGARSVLEWGVGGGMNPAHIRTRPYYAVDISERNLLEAAQYGITPILIAVGDVSHTRLKLPPVDLFISTAVFQHFPSVKYARRVLELVKCKAALIQVRRGRRNPTRKYAESVTTACTWTAAEFADLLEDTGYRVEWMEHGHADYLYFGCERNGAKEFAR